MGCREKGGESDTEERSANKILVMVIFRGIADLGYEILKEKIMKRN